MYVYAQKSQNVFFMLKDNFWGEYKKRACWIYHKYCDRLIHSSEPFFEKIYKNWDEIM